MPRAASDALSEYNARRRFDRTPEPRGKAARRRKGGIYAIQKHAARRLHYDLRLELDGVLLSWAVTRGPSLDPADKRLAVRTEDHPIDYAEFEGVIPEGNYGAGTVLLWDRGTWEPLGDPHDGLKNGKLAFRLAGDRLQGRWALVRFRGEEGKRRENWLLIKERDGKADPDADVTESHTASVASGRDLDAIAAEPDAAWTGSSGGKAGKKPAGKKAKSTFRRKSGKTALPGFRPPALATLTDALPDGEKWLFEVKFDGYRALAAADGGAVRIYTRNGLDWTRRYPAIADALAALDLHGALLDGEIAVFDSKGRSDFGALQRALKGEGGGLSYFVFDLLAEAGEDLADKPLKERKKRLRTLLGKAGRTGPVYYTDHVEGDGGEMHETLCERGFEGVIAKRADAPYRSGRGRSWLKIKCARTQEFVIVGWSPSSARGRPFSSILLGQYEGGVLRYAGKAGSGFSADELASLSRRFAALARKAPTVEAPRVVARGARWVRPELVAQVGLSELTRDGLVRQGRYLGLREDKPTRAVEPETPEPVRKAAAAAAAPKKVAGKAGGGAPKLAGIALSNPDKVLFPRQGVTKRDLAAYLDMVSGRMMPHVANRLLTLVRCPEGRAADCFYQRHGDRGMPEPFRRLAVKGKDGTERRYLYIAAAPGLVSAAQMGALELHIWGSRIDRIDRPDRIVFDLDPDPALGFDRVKQGARRLRDVLGALELESFPLLTGGKGIHVVVPIRRRHDWATVKGFARAVAERVVDDAPDRYVATMTRAKRKGRVFIDFFRNDRTATAVAPYSPRAREGAPVAWPVGWDELDDLPAANCVRLATAAERLDGPDPWSTYGKTRQSLTAAAQSALGL